MTCSPNDVSSLALNAVGVCRRVTALTKQTHTNPHSESKHTGTVLQLQYRRGKWKKKNVTRNVKQVHKAAMSGN